MTTPETDIAEEEKTEININEQSNNVSADPTIRQIRSLLAAINDVHEDVLTKEIIRANIRKDNKKWYAQARAEGKHIITKEEAQDLADKYDRDREKWLEHHKI